MDRERKNVVLACSALKKNYRDQLSVSSEVKFVYLKGSYDLIYQRFSYGTATLPRRKSWPVNSPIWKSRTMPLL